MQPHDDFDVGTVSCLCVTRGDVRLLTRAVRCFEAQTYPNTELVVVHEGMGEDCLELLRGVSGKVVVACSRKESLGQLRNRSLAISTGAFVCQWDDDDWHAPQRIEMQLRQLIRDGSDACLLTNWMIVDELERRVYLSHTGQWEGSLLCRRDLSVIRSGYPGIARGEDTVLVNALKQRHRVTYLTQPELYAYIYHGQNTWDARHFNDLFSWGIEQHGEAATRVLLDIA